MKGIDIHCSDLEQGTVVYGNDLNKVYREAVAVAKWGVDSVAFGKDGLSLFVLWNQAWCCVTYRWLLGLGVVVSLIFVEQGVWNEGRCLRV